MDKTFRTYGKERKDEKWDNQNIMEARIDRKYKEGQIKRRN